MSDEIIKVKLPSGPVLNIHKNQHNEWVWEIKMTSVTIGISYEGYQSREECIRNISDLHEAISILKTDNRII